MNIVRCKKHTEEDKFFTLRSHKRDSEVIILNGGVSMGMTVDKTIQSQPAKNIDVMKAIKKCSKKYEEALTNLAK